MKCDTCGAPVENGTCTYCGKVFSKEPENAAFDAQSTQTYSTSSRTAGLERNKYIAIALCFSLGYLGGHKFYEKKIGMGILYLCTLGLFGVGYFIDLVNLIFKPHPYYV